MKTKYRVKSLHHYNQRKQTEVITVPAMCNYVRVFESFFRQTSNWSCSQNMKSSTPEIDQIGCGNWHWTRIWPLNCRSSFGVLRHRVFQHSPLIFCCFSFVSAPLALSAAISASPKNGNDRKTLPSSLYSRYFLCRNILMEEELHFQFFM